MSKSVFFVILKSILVHRPYKDTSKMKQEVNFSAGYNWFKFKVFFLTGNI